MSETPLIEIQNATVWRGSSCVLRDFTLSIGQAERVAVLGPNGSGKTTLLKTITQEIRPVVNEHSWIKVLGRRRWDVWSLRQHFGLVSQDLQNEFLPNSTVLDVIVSGFFSTIGVHDHQAAEVGPEHLVRARAVMGSMGIETLEGRKYRSLSTGQQRRCLLARALVHSPKMLIFDEPTSGLDMAASFDFQARVGNLARSGCGLVWVTHHLNDLPPEIERVVVLKSGQIVADGPKGEVLKADLLSEVYETQLRIAEIDGCFLAFPGSLEGNA